MHAIKNLAYIDSWNRPRVLKTGNIINSGLDEISSIADTIFPRSTHSNNNLMQLRELIGNDLIK